MSNIVEYLDAALKVQKLPSDRQLCLRIGEKPATICQWRSGTHLPHRDASMRKLAELAGMDVEQAMLDLGQWRAERADDAATASVYATMRKHLQQARRVSVNAAVGCVALGSLALNPSPEASASDMVQTGHDQAEDFILWEI